MGTKLSINVCKPSTKIPHFVFIEEKTWEIHGKNLMGQKLKKIFSLKLLRQLEQNFARMVFVRFSMAIPHFVVILEKHGCHFLILIDRKPKNIPSETTSPIDL
jgi:hypothetical protein